MLWGQIKICPEGCGLMTGWSEAEFSDSRAPAPVPTQALRSEKSGGQVPSLAWDLPITSPLGWKGGWQDQDDLRWPVPGPNKQSTSTLHTTVPTQRTGPPPGASTLGPLH